MALQENNQTEKPSTRGEKLLGYFYVLLALIFITIVIKLIGGESNLILYWALILFFIFIGWVNAFVKVAGRIDTKEEMDAYFQKMNNKIEQAKLENNIIKIIVIKKKIAAKCYNRFHHEKNNEHIYLSSLSLKAVKIGDYSLIHEYFDNYEWIIKNSPDDDTKLKKELENDLKYFNKQKEIANIALEKKINNVKIEKALKEIDRIISRINSMI